MTSSRWDDPPGMSRRPGLVSFQADDVQTGRAMTEATRQPDYGARPAAWAPARPRIHPLALLVAWLLSAAALLIAAWIVPGASTRNFGGALVAALVIALLNGLLPPLGAALRLPFTLLTGFLL